MPSFMLDMAWIFHISLVVPYALVARIPGGLSSAPGAEIIITAAENQYMIEFYGPDFT